MRYLKYCIAIAALNFGGVIHANDVFFENFNELSSSSIKIHTQFPAPDLVEGVDGKAWRTDGFSSWAEANHTINENENFTLSFWVALESYPSDREVPVDLLTPSSFVNQRSQSKGFDIFIDTYGRWGLWFGTNKKEVKMSVDAKFPLHKWSNIVLAHDAKLNQLSLYLNGGLVAQAKLPEEFHFSPAQVPLTIARGYETANIINFTVNYLNGAFDLFHLSDEAMSATEVAQLYQKYKPNESIVEQSLIVPSARFASDHLRPKSHAMPPANWTNEPHGLVRKGEWWHMFYQRTPNGPYKTQMHWGHMATKDLVNWVDYPDALRPELQNETFGFDQKGIWSGDVIVDGDLAYAFYTSVNHFDRLVAANPGISMAVSRDPDLLEWEKFGPIINTEHVKDFRDPYLWKEGDTWHMIIGAALEDGGGLAYYVLDKVGDTPKWQYKKRFTNVSYRVLDIGSLIWEMPVFEALDDETYVLVVNPIAGAVEKYGEPATRAVYWTGTWKEGVFTPHYNKPKPLDILVGHLSPTVARADDGFLRAIGIIDERRVPQAQEDAGWAHTFSFPRKWFVSQNGHALGQAPAPELKTLRGDLLLDQKGLDVGNQGVRLLENQYAYELLLEGQSLAEGTITLNLLANPEMTEVTKLMIDGSSGKVVLDKSKSSVGGADEGPQVLNGRYELQDFGSIDKIRLYVDGSVVEVFINDAAAFSFRSYPADSDSNNTYLMTSKEINLSSVKAWELLPNNRKFSVKGLTEK